MADLQRLRWIAVGAVLALVGVAVERAVSEGSRRHADGEGGDPEPPTQEHQTRADAPTVPPADPPSGDWMIEAVLARQAAIQADEPIAPLASDPFSDLDPATPATPTVWPPTEEDAVETGYSGVERVDTDRLRASTRDEPTTASRPVTARAAAFVGSLQVTHQPRHGASNASSGRQQRTQ